LLIWKDGIWSISRGFVISWQRCRYSGGRHMNSIRMYGKCRDWYGMCTGWAMIWCRLYRVSIYPLVPSIMYLLSGSQCFSWGISKDPSIDSREIRQHNYSFCYSIEL
jgi:hypothetical protein